MFFYLENNMIPITEFFVGGRAIFTIEVPKSFVESFKCNPHYTFRIRYKEKDQKGFYFVELLTGPDNTRNYTYVGLFNPDTGQLALTARSKVSHDAWSVRLFRRCMAKIFENDTKAITDAGFDVHHEKLCGKCGKELSTPESIKIGLGPKCRKS